MYNEWRYHHVLHKARAPTPIFNTEHSPSQLSPRNPTGHVQRCLPIAISVHVPPFLHVVDLHSVLTAYLTVQKTDCRSNFEKAKLTFS